MKTARIAAVTALLLLGGCTGVTGGAGRAHPSSTPGSTGAGTTSPAVVTCPASYAAPDPHRPTVALAFTFSADLATVRGTEHVSFTPDEPITELVFRLTANTVPTVAEGNKIVVNSATADPGGATATFTRAGAAASTQGGLLHIFFAHEISAGTTVSADIAFTITVGAESFDRFGRADTKGHRYSWIGSAQPLLAWERGFGWHSEDLIQFTAESATSEAMNTDLTVTAPAGDTVIMSGDPEDRRIVSSGSATWHAHIDAARDVSVAVGPFAVSDTVVQGVHLRLGAYTSALRDQLVPEFTRAITQLAARFGPFPFPSLSVVRLPAEGGGIEYPSSILMLDGSRLVAVHEAAHQWFYAMVGNSQALHPWLDEAFASYAEELVDNDAAPFLPSATPGAVDSSTESYGADERAYYATTYNKGAAALHEARAAAGPAAWDAAMRCYVNANAWRIANPADFAAAIKNLPKAVAVLTKAGALP